MVRAPEGPAECAVVPGGAGFLGNCLFRVPAAGAGQPGRLRNLQPRSAEDPAGGDHPLGVRAVCLLLHGAAVEARLPLGGVLSGWGSVLYLSRVKRAFSAISA